MAYFDPLTGPVNYVLIGRGGSQPLPPQQTPGLADVADADLNVVLDAQQGAGTTGAPLRYRGVELVTFHVIIRLWLSQHWSDWDSFRALLQTPPFGKLPAPLTVSHPWLTMQNISQAVVKSVGQPVLDDHMLATIRIKMIQYKAPRVTYSTVKATPDKPLSAIEKKLKAARLTLEAQNATGFQGFSVTKPMRDKPPACTSPISSAMRP